MPSIPLGIDAYAFQMATYTQLTPGGASGAVRVDYVIPNKAPKLVTIGYQVSEADVRLNRDDLSAGAARPSATGSTCPTGIVRTALGL